MKKKRVRKLSNRYTLKGIGIGLFILVLSLLFTLNSQAFGISSHTLIELFLIFPALWVLILLPILGGYFGYLVSNRFIKIIINQNSKIKREESRSTFFLDFINNLRQGNFEIAIPERNKEDQVGQSLLNLRDYLVKNKNEEELRRIEEKQRAWVTQGFAQFGDLLRKNNDNLEDLSYNIINYLVNYMNINQGGFFLISSADSGSKYFELKASIAFERKKFSDKIINWGEGLIGRCALEKQTIYITDIPNDYINITSGLGEANPRSLLLVPLKVNDEVYGVIELASFDEFHKFEIDFLEKTAESIASTISTVKINIQTSKLLKETQMQAEKMAQQEEELRQNLEEMQATQEESDRREVEMKGILEAIDHAAISCEFEIDGSLIAVNQNFLKTFKYSHDEVEGQNLKIFFFKNDVEELDEILSLLKNGQNFKGRVKRRTKLGEEVYLLSTYTPVIDNEGDIIKILSLENDITEQVHMEEALKRSKDELGLMLEHARNEVKEQFKEIEGVKIRNEKTLEGALDAILTTNKDGIVEFFNVAAEKLWGYDRSEILGQNVSILFSKEATKSDEFISALVNSGSTKIVGERREAPIKNKYGDEIPVLFLLSEAKVGDDHSYTAFIQNVEVELF